MSDPSGGIPELEYFDHQQGRPKTRLEMEHWLREKIPKVHWLRIIACKLFHLPKPISWDMREIVLKHWLLDEMIRRQQITGDMLGVNQTASNDDGELRQFQQRLAALIQSGQAVLPQHVEGVDMNGFTPPPPPNGQSQYTAPPAPPGPPAGPPAPPMPAGPPQGYAQPPMQQTQMPGPGFQAPPPPQQAAPMGPPGYGPPPGPPMSGPPMSPPPSAPPQQAATGRGRRKAADAGPPAAPPPAAPVPAMGPPGVQPPSGFAPLPAGAPSFGPPPVVATPPQAQNTQMAAAQNSIGDALYERLENLTKLVEAQGKQIAELQKVVQMTSMVTTILGRGMYSKQGTADVAGFLQELGQPLPQ
jgi:hypothetical protein